MRIAILPLLVLSLAACRAPAPAESAAGAAPGQAAPGPVAQGSSPAVKPEAAVAPATGSLHVDLPAAGTIGYAGFGPAKFGDSAEAVRMAWGGDLGDAKPEEPGGCYYLSPVAPAQQDAKIGFRVEADKFARIDVYSAQIEAPGGGRVGMDEAGLRQLYGKALQSMPHKYVEGGHYLSLAAADGGPGKLVFETDVQGKVSSWRIGMPPQVDYVEGCG